MPLSVAPMKPVTTGVIPCSINKGKRLCLNQFTGGIHQRGGVGKVVIGHDQPGGIHGAAFDPHLAEQRRKNAGVQALAQRGDGIDAARGDLAHHLDAVAVSAQFLDEAGDMLFKQ